MLGVAYADGQKTGTQLRASIEDACILISRLLQYGDGLGAIGGSLSSVQGWDGVEMPGSPVGAIVAEMQAEEREA